VRSLTEAGTGCPIALNGAFFAQGSVAVLEGSAAGGEKARLGAFIDSLEDGEDRLPRPRRGDRAGDLVPYAVRLSTVRVRMRDLEGTGISTFINLDRTLEGNCGAELVVSGIAVASGTVVVIGENMGMRIVTVDAELPQGSFPRTTGSVLAPGYGAEVVKDYNFRMPDCFTKRAITRFHAIHLDFLRSWLARLPSNTAWQLSLVDQLNYGEWLDDVAGRAMTVASFAPARRERVYEREGAPRLPETFLVEAPVARYPIGETELAEIRSWAETRLGHTDEIPFQLALDSPAASATGDADFEITLACIRNGWLDVGDLRIGRDAGASGAGLSSKPYFSAAADRSRMILLARFTRSDGSRMDIVYPQSLLAPYLPALGR